MVRKYADGDDLGDDAFGPELSSYFTRILDTGSAILFDCEPTAGSGDTVDVASGRAYVAGSQQEVSSDSIALNSRDSFDRLDLITIDEFGSVRYDAGSSELRCPDLPASRALVAVVKVPQDGSGVPITVFDARSFSDRFAADTVNANTARAEDPRSGQSGTLFTDTLTATSELELPVLSSDPATSDLDGGEIWINDVDDAVKHYNAGTDSIVTIPTFDPGNSDLRNNFLRVYLPSGNTKAIECVDPDDPITPAFPHLRVATSSDVLVFHDQAAGAVSSGIDDFEDGDLSEYSDPQGVFQITTSRTKDGTTYAGQFEDGSVEGASLYSTSGLPDYPQAGDVFEAWFYAESGSINGGFLFGYQDSNNRYEASSSFDRGTWIEINKLDGGNKTEIARDENTDLTSGAWYRFQLEWDSDGDMRLAVFDDSGNLVGDTYGTDSTWTSGGFGWQMGLNPNNGTQSMVFDEAFVTDPGGASVTLPTTIDDFEDGDISEYSGDTGGYVVDQVNVQTGSYSLHVDGTQEGPIIRSSSGLDRYPSQGDKWEFWCRDGGSGNLNLNMEYGNPDESTRGYAINVSPRVDEFRLIENSQGVIASTSQTFNANEWYRVVVDWGTDDSHSCTVYDSSGTQLATVSATDSNHTSGGVGWSTGTTSSGQEGYYDGAEML